MYSVKFIWLICLVFLICSDGHVFLKSNIVIEAGSEAEMNEIVANANFDAAVAGSTAYVDRKISPVEKTNS